MKIEVIYGHDPRNVFIWKHRYPKDSVLTVAEVIRDSKVALIYKLDLNELSFAIFTEKCKLEDQVKDGDRVAILRELVRSKAVARRVNTSK